MQTTQNITLKRLLALAAERQASDLLLVVGNKPVLRAEGVLTTLEQEEVVTQDFLEEVTDNILSDEQKNFLAKEREIIFTYDFVDQNRFRVDINQQRGLLSITFHYLPSVVKRLADLGFPKEVKDLADKESGLVLVGGEQGSGKTTTLAAFIETINHSQAKHILFLEQPIEYSLVSYKSVIEQQEIGKDVKDWLSALEIEEQSVDVLVLSKIVNGDVFKRVLELAGAGILVFAAVDASSTEYLIQSLLNKIDIKERNFYAKIFSEVFQGSVVQKLLPRVGGGQVLALEVSFATPPFAGLIREQKFEQIPNMIQTSRADGMILMDKYLLELARSGQIDKKLAVAHAHDPQAMAANLKV